jgi:hypothetical protein
MDIASGLVFNVARRGGRLGLPLALAVVIALVLACIGTVAVTGLLQPESEVVLATPFRWS